ncbi:uncharacterized protein [Molothrus aeneus]|uniref:uncharacterized protein n=1 Tax=Molothrus aeneus TaxID=84833 RepID=UPI003459A9E9
MAARAGARMTGSRCGQQHGTAAEGNRRRAERQPRQRSLEGPLSPTWAEPPAPSRRGRWPPQRCRQPQPPAHPPAPPHPARPKQEHPPRYHLPRHRLPRNTAPGTAFPLTACPETPPPAPPPQHGLARRRRAGLPSRHGRSAPPGCGARCSVGPRWEARPGAGTEPCSSGMDHPAQAAPAAGQRHRPRAGVLIA